MLVSLSLVAGCSTLKDAAVSALTGASKDGISLDAQVGDRENEVQAGGMKGTGDVSAKGKAKVQIKNEQSKARVDQAETVIIENIPWWVFLIAISGWIVPTPTTIYKWVRRFSKGNFK